MKNGDPRFEDKKYYGIYRGIVKDVADDKKLGRVVLQVPEIFGSDLLTDWAWPKNGYFSGMDKGDFLLPDVGDGVWAEFEAGDAHRPVYSGRWWGMPGGTSEVPELAREIEDESQQSPKGTDVMTTATGEVITEPAIAYAAKYGSNRVLKTKSGIVFELDDTTNNVRIHIWHPKKTYFEVRPDGGLVQRVKADRYTVIEVDDNLHVKGNHNVSVDGSASLNVIGDYTIQVVGDMRVNVTGNIVRESQGSITDSAPVINQNPT